MGGQLMFQMRYMYAETWKGKRSQGKSDILSERYGTAHFQLSLTTYVSNRSVLAFSPFENLSHFLFRILLFQEHFTLRSKINQTILSVQLHVQQHQSHQSEDLIMFLAAL